MDWPNQPFDWNQARAFLATAEEGSLSAAARVLGLTQPTLGRQVAALEETLGVALFERAGRGLTLTPGGAELLDHIRVMGAAAGDFSRAASGLSQSLTGTVKITASQLYAAHLLPPVVARLRAAAPQLTVRIVAADEVRDLRRHEADVAIRHIRPTQNDLVAKRLPDHTARLYATPAYLASLGAPVTPEALSQAQFLGFESNAPLIEGLNALGLSLTPGNFPIISANQFVQWEMVKAGLGIGVMSTLIGAREPAVTCALPELAPITFPVWLVAHRDVARSRRVRLVFDTLEAAIAPLGQG